MNLARNSLYSLAGSAVPLAISLVTIPFFIEAIGPARYGALAIAWLLLGYFGQADFGIGRAITQRVGALSGESREVKAQAVASAFFAIALFSLLATALVYASARWFFSGPFRINSALQGELLASVVPLALCAPLVAIGGVASGALMGLERFALASLGQVVSASAIQLLPLLAAYAIGPELPVLIVAALIGRALAVLMLLAGVWRTFFAGARTSLDLAELKGLARFGGWIMLSALISPLMIFADRLVIGAVLGAVAVAAYSIPFQLAARAQMFPIALVSALFPRFAAEEGGQAQERCRHFTIFVGQIFAPLVIALMCLAAPLLEAWLGASLDPRSVVIGQVVLAGFWLNALANVPFAFIQARGNPRFTALLHLAELPVYAALLFAFSASFGLVGVAMAFSLRCAIDSSALVLRSGAGALAIARGLALPGLLVCVALAVSQRTETALMGLLAAGFLAPLAVIVGLLQMPRAVRERLAQVPLLQGLPLIGQALQRASR